MVRLVDSAEKVGQLLKPFIANSDYFGFDSEWDMSYFGSMGDLCLIQISNETETLLIDIHAFKNILKWNDEQFKDLFTLLFDHSKPIYGKNHFSFHKITFNLRICYQSRFERHWTQLPFLFN